MCSAALGSWTSGEALMFRSAAISLERLVLLEFTTEKSIDVSNEWGSSW